MKNYIAATVYDPSNQYLTVAFDPVQMALAVSAPLAIEALLAEMNQIVTADQAKYGSAYTSLTQKLDFVGVTGDKESMFLIIAISTDQATTYTLNVRLMAMNATSSRIITTYTQELTAPSWLGASGLGPCTILGESELISYFKHTDPGSASSSDPERMYEVSASGVTISPITIDPGTVLDGQANLIVAASGNAIVLSGPLGGESAVSSAYRKVSGAWVQTFTETISGTYQPATPIHIRAVAEAGGVTGIDHILGISQGQSTRGLDQEGSFSIGTDGDSLTNSNTGVTSSFSDLLVSALGAGSTVDGWPIFASMQKIDLAFWTKLVGVQVVA